MKNLDIPVLNAIYKLLSNSLNGRTIMDYRKYSTIARLCSEAEINQEISHPKFKEIRKISKDCYLVTRSKEHIFFSSPSYIGTVVLQKAKLTNLKLHYTVVKPSAFDYPEELMHFCNRGLLDLILRSREIIQSITLSYSDTDSLLYHLVFRKKGLTLVDAFDKTFLREFLDKSNFKILDKRCEFRAGQHGKLKSEIGDRIPQVAYFISPKVYSIELKNRPSSDTSVDAVAAAAASAPSELSYKRVAKGLDKNQLGTTVDHSVYRSVYEETIRCPLINTCSFRFNPKISAMSTLRTSKVPLSLRDDKRFWVNKDVSVAYGHEVSFEHGFNGSHIQCVKGGRIVWGNALPNDSVTLDAQEDTDLFNILCDLEAQEASESENESDLDETPPLRNIHKRPRGQNDFSNRQTKKKN